MNVTQRGQTGDPQGAPDSDADRQDDAGPPEKEVGAILRETRIATGQSVQEVADNLRIRRNYLEALEAGDISSLPGRAYAVGYLRSYARFLGLDEERAIALLKHEVTDLESPRKLTFPSPAPEGKVPSGAIIVIALVLMVAGYFGWQEFDTVMRLAGQDTSASSAPASSTKDSEKAAAPAPTKAKAPAPTATASAPVSSEDEPAPTPPAAPVVTVAPTPALTTSPLPTSPQPAMTTATMTPATGTTETTSETMAATALTALTPALTPAVTTTTPAAVIQSDTQSSTDSTAVDTTTTALTAAPSTEDSVPATATDTATAPASQTGASQTTANPTGGDPLVVIQADSDSWVLVRAPDSTTVMTRVMRAGDSYQVPNQKGLRLFTGNAGALTILVDGSPVGSLGEFGAVMRDIDLDPQSLLN